MKKQIVFERECIHRDEAAADGDFFNGVFFVQALQRLRADEAVKIARKVSPFFWNDAPVVMVWLCRACAAELHLGDAPRAVAQGMRR